MKDLNIKLNTLNLIEEKVGNRLENISTGDNSLNIIPITLAPKPTNARVALIKLKRFCKTFDIANRIKWQPTDWKITFKILMLGRKLLSKTYKEINSDSNH